jgi:hypothetical protein
MYACVFSLSRKIYRSVCLYIFVFLNNQLSRSLSHLLSLIPQGTEQLASLANRIDPLVGNADLNFDAIHLVDFVLMPK